MAKPPTQFLCFTRVLIAVILLWINQSSLYGQIPIFRSDTVLRIEFYSSSGYYNFKKRADIGKRDTLVIKHLSNEWEIESHHREDITYFLENDSFAIKGKDIKLGNRQIPGKLIDSLLHELNQSYYPANHLHFGFNPDQFEVSSKRVSSTAKRSHWVLDKKEYKSKKSEKAMDAAATLSDIRLFDKFLAGEFDTSGYAIVTDAWDVMHIWVVTTSNCFRFEGKYPNTIKIPWYDFGTPEELLPRNLVNPKINKYMLAILPKDFLRRERLCFDKIIDQYIEWHLAKSGDALNPNYHSD